LANISTRGVVGTADGVMIGGFILGGNGSTVVVRALGPSLSAVGISNFLPDPTVTVVDAFGTTVGTDDNWQDTQESEITALDLNPDHGEESALLVTLPPGAYTAIVAGKDGGTGVGLVEVYNVK
jgi:hypothetical protein